MWDDVERIDDAALVITKPGHDYGNTYFVMGVKKVTPEPMEDETLPDEYRKQESEFCYVVLGKDSTMSFIPIRAVDNGEACFAEPDSELRAAYEVYLLK